MTFRIGWSHFFPLLSKLLIGTGAQRGPRGEKKEEERRKKGRGKSRLIICGGGGCTYSSSFCSARFHCTTMEGQIKVQTHGFPPCKKDRGGGKIYSKKERKRKGEKWLVSPSSEIFSFLFLLRRRMPRNKRFKPPFSFSFHPLTFFSLPFLPFPHPFFYPFPVRSSALSSFFPFLIAGLLFSFISRGKGGGTLKKGEAGVGDTETTLPPPLLSIPPPFFFLRRFPSWCDIHQAR